MAKRKGRAARKQIREKAAKANDHGLPPPESAPKPQKTRKVGGDTVAAAVASEKAGRAGPPKRSAAPAEKGLPVVGKVLIGAAVALGVVYGLSQLRKSGDVPDPSQSVASAGDDAGLADDSTRVLPAEEKTTPLSLEQPEDADDTLSDDTLLDDAGPDDSGTPKLELSEKSAATTVREEKVSEQVSAKVRLAASKSPVREPAVASSPAVVPTPKAPASTAPPAPKAPASAAPVPKPASSAVAPVPKAPNPVPPSGAPAPTTPAPAVPGASSPSATQ